jgi:hypothetical protein
LVAATSKGNLEISNSYLMMGKVQWYRHCFYILFNTSPTAISPDKKKGHAENTENISCK